MICESVHKYSHAHIHARGNCNVYPIFFQVHVITVTLKAFNDRRSAVSLVTTKTNKKEHNLFTSDVST
jgi:hypothetical protein